MVTLSEVGKNETFKGYVLIKNIRKGTTKTEKPFLSVMLQDQTTEMDMKVWNDVASFEEEYQEGNIIYLVGNVSEYMGNLQMNLGSIRNITEEDEVSISDLLPSAPVSGLKLLEVVKKVLSEEVTNEKLRKITESIVNKYEDSLLEYPAAKSNHHAYVSGLLYHTRTMLINARFMCKLYPFLNRSLLLSGVILHDIGKIKEYTGVVSTDTTLTGRLKGHISIISEEVLLTAQELGIAGEEVELLQHMVLSHHGKLEWGSPVSPILPEAEVLHLLDVMDASMDALRSALSKTEKGEFTERIFSLGNRSYYRSTIEDDE